jgi:hypothetical protein
MLSDLPSLDNLTSWTSTWGSAAQMNYLYLYNHLTILPDDSHAVDLPLIGLAISSTEHFLLPQLRFLICPIYL